VRAHPSDGLCTPHLQELLVFVRVLVYYAWLTIPRVAEVTSLICLYLFTRVHPNPNPGLLSQELLEFLLLFTCTCVLFLVYYRRSCWSSLPAPPSSAARARPQPRRRWRWGWSWRNSGQRSSCSPPRSRREAAFTQYCHYQYCMLNGKTRGAGGNQILRNIDCNTTGKGCRMPRIVLITARSLNQQTRSL